MTSPVEVVFLFDIAHTLLMSAWPQRSRNPPVALTATGKPLFKAPDGGDYEIVRVTKVSPQSGLQRASERVLS